MPSTGGAPPATPGAATASDPSAGAAAPAGAEAAVEVVDARPLGQILVDLGVRHGRRDRGRAGRQADRCPGATASGSGDLLVDEGRIDQSALARPWPPSSAWPTVDLTRTSPDTSLVATLAQGLAEDLDALPVRRDEAGVVVAVADPTIPDLARDPRPAPRGRGDPCRLPRRRAGPGPVQGLRGHRGPGRHHPRLRGPLGRAGAGGGRHPPGRRERARRPGHHPHHRDRPSSSGRPTSTSSPWRTGSGCATASTAPSRRCCRSRCPCPRPSPAG